MRRRLAVVAAVGFVIVSAISPAVAQDSLESDLDAIAAEIDAVAAQIQSSEARQNQTSQAILDSQTTLNQVRAALDSTRSEIAAVRADIDNRRQHLRVVQDQLASHYAALARTRQQLTTTRQATAQWAREMYMTAGSPVPDVVFSVDAISDLTLTLDLLDLIQQRDEQSVARLQALEVQEDRQILLIEEEETIVEEELAGLAVIEADLDALAHQLADRSAEYEAIIGRQRGLLAELRAEEEHFREELDVLEREQEEVKRLIQERQSSGGEAPGVLARPVPGRIGSGFGYRIHPISGVRKLHTGVDMSSAYGTPIVSGADGVVIYAGWRGGYGNTVMVDHGGGMVTLYAHQSSLAVARNQRVSRGEVVGYVGSTGYSTGPHLHFEVRLNGTPVDPVPYL